MYMACVTEKDLHDEYFQISVEYATDYHFNSTAHRNLVAIELQDIDWWHQNICQSIELFNHHFA